MLSVEMFTVTRIRRKPEEKGGFQRIGRPSIAVRYEAALSGVEGRYRGPPPLGGGHHLEIFKF